MDHDDFWSSEGKLLGKPMNPYDLWSEGILLGKPVYIFDLPENEARILFGNNLYDIWSNKTAKLPEKIQIQLFTIVNISPEEKTITLKVIQKEENDGK